MNASSRSVTTHVAVVLLAFSALLLFGAAAAGAATAPTITRTFPSAVGTTEATFNAEVDSGGAPITECRFRYGTDESYGREAGCAPDARLRADLELKATSGEFRITYGGEATADLPFGATASEVKSALAALPALAPLVSSLNVTGIPRHVEIGGVQGCVESQFVISAERPLSVPSQPVGVEPGSVPLANACNNAGHEFLTLTLAESLRAIPSELTPATLYHFQLDMATGAGAAAGTDARLRTYPVPGLEPEMCPNAAVREQQHATFLPDCRAYEMVSPADKNGGYVVPMSARTRAAADGEAVGFTSLQAFAGAEGTAVATDYISERQSGPGPAGTGWLTHAITPPQEPLTSQGIVLGAEPRFTGAFVEELGLGVFLADQPVNDEESEYVKNVPNLYLRTNLRSAGPGHYTLLTACPACAKNGALRTPSVGEFEKDLGNPQLAAVSSDGQRVTFESGQPLTADTPTRMDPRLFEWDHGELRLSGRIPSGAGRECDDQLAGQACVAADASMAGQDHPNPGYLTPHTLSDGSDGHSRVFFTRPTADGVTTQAERFDGNLYVREDGHRTIKLNIPNPGVPAPPEFGPASFWDASTNGERAFFTTRQVLTKDAVFDGAAQLYMWTAQPDASGGHLTLLNPPHTNAETVIGASADGSYVYFDDLGTGGEKQILLWHEGTVSDVASAPQRYETIYTVLRVGADDRRIARVSPDGTRLLFFSRDAVGPTGYPQSPCPVLGDGAQRGCLELYLYEATSSTPTQPDLRCVSCRPDLALPEAWASNTVFALNGAERGDFHETAALSSDGRYAFFSTAEALVPEDTNGVEDAYEYDSVTGEVHLLSSGKGSSPSWFLDASADGHDVFIDTAQPLVGWDHDGAYDLYDVRVGGGLPEPAAPAPPCSETTCPGPLTAGPTVPAFGSGASGPGNPPPPPSTGETHTHPPAKHHCPKGKHPTKHHHKIICVKNKTRKHFPTGGHK
jgi:hypothetical protein